MKKGSKKVTAPWLFFSLLALLVITAAGAGAAPAAPEDVDPLPVTRAAEGELQSYVVILEDWPLAVYDGELVGMPATKAAPGMRVNLQSDAAQDYEAYLRQKQETVRIAAGIDQEAILHTYTTALNGFAAVMSEAEAQGDEYA